MYSSPHLSTATNQKTIHETASDTFIAYGIRKFDPFFSLLNVQCIEMYEIKLRLSIESQDQNTPTVIEKKVIEKLMEVCMKAFYTFWSRGCMNDFQTTRFNYEHVHADDFKYGDQAFLYVSLEKTENGVAIIESQLISVKSSLDTTTTRTVTNGEGAISIGGIVSEKTMVPSSPSHNEAINHQGAKINEALDEITKETTSGPRSQFVLQVPAEFVENSSCYDDVSTGTFSRLFSSLSCSQFSKNDGSTPNDYSNDQSTVVQSEENSSYEPLNKKRKEPSQTELKTNSTSNNNECSTSSTRFSFSPSPTMQLEDSVCDGVIQQNKRKYDVKEGSPKSSMRAQQTVYVGLESGRGCGLKFDKEMKVVLVESRTLCEGLVFVGDVVTRVNGFRCTDTDEFYYHFFQSNSFVSIDLMRTDYSYEDMQNIYEIQEKLQNESSKRSIGFVYLRMTIATDGKEGVLGCSVRSSNGKVYVWTVEKGSLAERYLKKGDRIWEVNGNTVMNEYEVCQLIAYYFEVNASVCLSLERPESPDACITIEQVLEALEPSQLSTGPIGIPLIVQIPPKIVHPVMEIGSEENRSPSENDETVLNTVVSSASPSSIFDTIREDVNDLNENSQPSKSASKWSKKKKFALSLIIPPEENAEELERMELEQNTIFTLINVKNRVGSPDQSTVLQKCLHEIGIPCGFKLISTVRMPIKSSRYMIRFEVTNPIHTRILYKLIGSETNWTLRFNKQSLQSESAFVWKDISVDQISWAVLAVELNRYDGDYQLPRKMDSLNQRMVLASLSSSPSRHQILAEIGKVCSAKIDDMMM
ncbi:unnamed protein product [Caenorhabditis brenneri]